MGVERKILMHTVVLTAPSSFQCWEAREWRGFMSSIPDSGEDSGATVSNRESKLRRKAGSCGARDCLCNLWGPGQNSMHTLFKNVDFQDVDSRVGHL